MKQAVQDGFGINNLQWLMCRKTKWNETKPKFQILVLEQHRIQSLMFKLFSPVNVIFIPRKKKQTLSQEIWVVSTHVIKI